MKTYEQLRYIYLSNIAHGDISQADQAAMLAELKDIKTSMRKAGGLENEPTNVKKFAKTNVAA